MRPGLLLLLMLLSGLRLPATGPPPRFQDFAAPGPPYRGPHAAPRLRPGTAAWLFRTRIREAARQAPNFAGHYVLAAWGSGSSCVHYAVVDVKAGHVYFDGNTVTSDGLVGMPDSARLVDFRVTSRLLIFTGRIDEASQDAGPHYFQFHHGRLVPIH